MCQYSPCSIRGLRKVKAVLPGCPKSEKDYSAGYSPCMPPRACGVGRGVLARWRDALTCASRKKETVLRKSSSQRPSMTALRKRSEKPEKFMPAGENSKTQSGADTAWLSSPRPRVRIGGRNPAAGGAGARRSRNPAARPLEDRRAGSSASRPPPCGETRGAEAWNR